MSERVEVENLVVGAGVVGLAVAAAISRSGRSVFVLEAGPRIGCGISSRNSEVIHSGIYYPTGSLKHRFCVEGRRFLYAYCAERGVAHRKCGKLIVATEAGDTERLATLARRARDNGVENVAPLDGPDVKRLEPAIRALAALHVRETGIIDSHGLMLALLAEIEDHGGAALLGHRVVRGFPITSRGYPLEVVAPSGPLIVVARRLVLAAGPWSHALTESLGDLAGDLTPPPLHLAKGSYFCLSGKAPFSRLIYPTPEPGGLGVHLTLALDGRVRFGPDVEWLDRADPDAVNFSVDPARGARFYSNIRRYWPGLAEGALTPDYASVRPKLSGPAGPDADFLILGPQDHGRAGLIALYGIESPGLTSSLAIGARIAQLLGK